MNKDGKNTGKKDRKKMMEVEKTQCSGEYYMAGTLHRNR